MFPVLYSPNELEHFLGFFTSWIRIRIQEAYLYPDPFGSVSETLAFFYCEKIRKLVIDKKLLKNTVNEVYLQICIYSNFTKAPY